MIFFLHDFFFFGIFWCEQLVLHRFRLFKIKFLKFSVIYFFSIKPKCVVENGAIDCNLQSLTFGSCTGFLVLVIYHWSVLLDCYLTQCQKESNAHGCNVQCDKSPLWWPKEMKKMLKAINRNNWHPPAQNCFGTLKV